MIAVDLFAGTGGATHAFRDHGWTVFEFDSVALPGARPGRVVADCRRLPLGAQLTGRVDFLWASPPCTEFSDANARVNHMTKRPSLELVTATLEAVALLRPRFWILENVRGAIPFLGIPVQKIGPFCLWGYFPLIDATWDAQTHKKWKAGRSAIARATVPAALSEAVYKAVDRGQRHSSILDLRPFRRHRVAAARATAARRRNASVDMFTTVGGETGEAIVSAAPAVLPAQAGTPGPHVLATPPERVCGVERPIGGTGLAPARAPRVDGHAPVDDGPGVANLPCWACGGRTHRHDSAFCERPGCKACADPFCGATDCGHLPSNVEDQ